MFLLLYIIYIYMCPMFDTMLLFVDMKQENDMVGRVGSPFARMEERRLRTFCNAAMSSVRSTFEIL